jgi:hypothetical protein
MKKILIITALVSALLTGCANPNDSINQSTDTSGSKYRKVTITGDLKMKPNPDAGYKGLVMAPSGTINLTFWFSIDGGEAVKQDNKVALTSYDGVPIGGAAPCVCTIDDMAMQPRSFAFKAELTPNASSYSDISTGQTTEQFDNILINLDHVPVVDPINFTCVCTGAPGTQNDYGAAYTGLLAPFIYTTYGIEVKPDGNENEAEWENDPITYNALPIPYLLDMNLITTEEIVGSLN